MSDKAFLLDTTKCTGCRACQVACKQWNDLPGERTEFFAGPELTNPRELSAITWNHVKFFPVDRTNPEKPVWQIMHKKCYHCNDANCEKVCPERAIHRVDGWVVIDQNRCIGCGACVNECIYKVPHIRADNDKTYKCNGCTVHTRDIPACAFACPTGALTYGARGRLLDEAQRRLAAYKRSEFPSASLYGKDEFDGMRMIVILKDRPDKYGIPVNPPRLNITKVEHAKDIYALLSVFTFGLAPLKRSAWKLASSMAGIEKRETIS
jgi:formate dehydrogenase iron-sulfur subunit